MEVWLETHQGYWNLSRKRRCCTDVTLARPLSGLYLKAPHTGQPALPIGSSGAPIIVLCNTEIKQLLVSSSMDYNKYYNFVPNILGLSSNYPSLYKFFNLSEVKFLQVQICPWVMAVERG